MDPRTGEAIANLEQRRRELRLAIDAVPPPLRARRPAPDRWSVDLIVEHLSIVEAGLVRLLGIRLRALPAAAGTSTAGRTAPLDPQRVLDRAQRVVAGANVQPKGGVAAETGCAALAKSRAELLEIVRAADGRDVGAISAEHPTLGPLDFWQWVDFVGLHEARHAAQIRETAAALARARA